MQKLNISGKINECNEASNSGFSSIQNSPTKEDTNSYRSISNNEEEDSQNLCSFDEIFKNKVNIEEQLRNDTDIEPKVKPESVKKKAVDMFAETDIFAEEYNSPCDQNFKTSGIENPALNDNWDDAEGYYRKSNFCFNYELI
jgi:hypothetical protein